MLQEICLEVGEQKAAAAHDVESAQRDAAFDAAQGNVQVDPALLENKRHLPIILYRAVISQILQGDIGVMCKQIQSMVLGYGRK